MNIHIELVKKWLADNDSVSQQELENNADAAYAYADDAANAVNDAAYAAANAAAYNAAAYWVKRYEELEKE